MFFLFVLLTMNVKEALSKFQEVVNNLEFARELQKSFLSLGQEVRFPERPSFPFHLTPNSSMTAPPFLIVRTSRRSLVAQSAAVKGPLAMTRCAGLRVVRSRRRWKSRRGGSSCCGRRWSSGGWRRCWRCSFYWTSWETSESDRRWRGPTAPVRHSSATATSRRSMTSTSWLGLKGTVTSGTTPPPHGAASTNAGQVHTWLCRRQVDWAVRGGVATLVGPPGGPRQASGRDHLWVN